ncbi:MAG TPA: hypothetical protein ENK02_15055 [Planctomycetes bacterium]|nr:hypothetical protein [Planctomycetota bacterium]
MALVLALVYWLYLDQTVTQEKSVYVTIQKDVHAQDALVSLKAQSLSLRVPNNYTISKVLDNRTGKVFNRKVLLTFRGPGGILRHLETNPSFFADIPESNAPEYDVTIKLRSIKSTKVELSGYLKSMDPPELRVHLVQINSFELSITPERIRILYPEEDREEWAKRIFPGSIKIQPSSVTLSGSRNLLATITPETPIFQLDLRSLPARWKKRMEQGGGNDRFKETFHLKILPAFSSLRMNRESIDADLEVAPPADFFPKGSQVYYSIPIRVNWGPLQGKESLFRVDNKGQIQIKSYNAKLSRLLQQQGEEWVRKNIEARVQLDELDAQESRSKEYFRKLQPEFTCWDHRFVTGRDLEIILKSPIFIKSKS